MSEPTSHSALKQEILKLDEGFCSNQKLAAIARGENGVERMTAVEILADALYESLGNGKMPKHGDFVYGLRIIAEHVGEKGLDDYGPFGLNVIRPLATEYNKRVPFVDRINQIRSFNATVVGETEPAYKMVHIFGE